MIVTHFQRRPHPTYFSMERTFSAIRQALPGWVDCRLIVSRYDSRGLLGRIYNIFDAVRKQKGISHITGDTTYLGLLLRKNRTILTIHDCASIHRLKGWRRFFYRVFWLWLPVRRCMFVTVISENTRREVMRYGGCPEEKIRVVPDAVGEEFQPTPQAFRQEAPRILQVGAQAHKNLGRVAAALRGIPCELHIVGHLSEEDRRALDASGVRYRVSHDLTDEQMLRAYQECDLVIFASTYEGFGMPIIEANAVGRPLVTSALPPMSDVAGNAAALVDPYDPASIREGVLRVIEDPAYRAQLVENGLCNAARYRAEAVAAQYAALYLQLAHNDCRSIEGRSACAE